MKPDLLLLDEPLSNLDAGLRDEMRALIRDLQRETGTTMLVVTHDQAEAVALADRVALMLDGKLAQEATPWDIYRRPASVAVARFFGGVNFLPGEASDDGGFHCALGCLSLPTRAVAGPGTLTIRPEAIRIGPASDAYPARVLSSAFLGTQARITLQIGKATLEALTTPDALPDLAPGTEIPVSLPAEALWVIPDAAR
jgi:ABC-type Fe3+/spermidine/putrescine transport system ATPase subunit